jgi:predicted amidohydrolase
VVKVALIQLRSQKNRAESIEHVVKMLRKAGAIEPEIVCLPELWYPKAVNSFEREFKHIIDMAIAKYDCHIRCLSRENR